MKPLFTQDELKMFRSPGGVRRINGRLLQAQRTMRPLHLKDLVIRCQFLHIGTGFYNERWNPGMHRHPDFQLEYALSGRFRFCIADIGFDLNAGQGLLIPPDISHSWKTIEKGSMLGMNLEIAGPNREIFVDRMRKAQEKGRGHLDSKKMKTSIRELFLLLGRPHMPLCGIDEIAVLLDFLHIELIREQCDLMRWRPPSISAEPKDADRSRQLAERAMQFIKANHTHSVQLQDVALHTGVSNQHIGRVFNARYGATIN
ncbi:MAG: AraC family ligand binding domain-containing protein, partial [Verrucomicrobiota bacterium]